jgi:hypothetical protein
MISRVFAQFISKNGNIRVVAGLIANIDSPRTGIMPQAVVPCSLGDTIFVGIFNGRPVNGAGHERS